MSISLFLLLKKHNRPQSPSLHNDASDALEEALIADILDGENSGREGPRRSLPPGIFFGNKKVEQRKNKNKK